MEKENIYCAKCDRNQIEGEGFAKFKSIETSIYLCTDCLMETAD